MRYASMKIVKNHNQIYDLMNRQTLTRSWRYFFMMFFIKSLKFDVFINCFNSTLRFYLSINDKLITTINHIIDFLQIFRVLFEQWINVFVVSINDISLSSSFSYEFMYSRRNDVEKKNNVTNVHKIWMMFKNDMW